MACRIQQWSDEMVCATCKLRWDTNDPEPPQCPDTGTVVPESGNHGLEDEADHKTFRISRAGLVSALAQHEMESFARCGIKPSNADPKRHERKADFIISHITGEE